MRWVAVKSTGARLLMGRLALYSVETQRLKAKKKDERAPRGQGAALYFSQPQKFLLSKEL